MGCHLMSFCGFEKQKSTFSAHYNRNLEQIKPDKHVWFIHSSACIHSNMFNCGCALFHYIMTGSGFVDEQMI